MIQIYFNIYNVCSTVMSECEKRKEYCITMMYFCIVIMLFYIYFVLNVDNYSTKPRFTVWMTLLYPYSKQVRQLSGYEDTVSALEIKRMVKELSQLFTLNFYFTCKSCTCISRFLV